MVRTGTSLAVAKREWQRHVIRDKELTGMALRVGHQLALFHVDTNHYLQTGHLVAYPGISLLAEAIGIDERNVQRAIKLLEDRGLVVANRSAGGKFLKDTYSSNKYLLVHNPPKEAALTPAQAPPLKVDLTPACTPPLNAAKSVTQRDAKSVTATIKGGPQGNLRVACSRFVTPAHRPPNLTKSYLARDLASIGATRVARSRFKTFFERVEESCDLVASAPSMQPWNGC